MYGKLSQEEVLAIRRRLAAGERQVDLAAEYGVSQMQISRIKRRVNWANIKEEN